MCDQKNMNGLFQMCSNLIKVWNKKPVNLDECERLLENLKVMLVKCQLDFLPNNDSALQMQQIITARDTLEIGAQWAVATKNNDAFARYMSQLKSYYLDYTVVSGDQKLDESPYKAQLLGLNLLRLLSENRLADFHTELERLKDPALRKSIYIRHPMQIEQYMMEGSYNKVFLARASVPSADYTFFMDILLETIRKEIAECLSKAYERLKISEATRMLFLKSPEEAVSYASKQADWSRSGDFFVFNRAVKADDVVPCKDLIVNTITYAKELEMIVWEGFLVAYFVRLFYANYILTFNIHDFHYAFIGVLDSFLKLFLSLYLN